MREKLLNYLEIAVNFIISVAARKRLDDFHVTNLFI